MGFEEGKKNKSPTLRRGEAKSGETIKQNIRCFSTDVGGEGNHKRRLKNDFQRHSNINMNNTTVVISSKSQLGTVGPQPKE